MSENDPLQLSCILSEKTLICRWRTNPGRCVGASVRAHWQAVLIDFHMPMVYVNIQVDALVPLFGYIGSCPEHCNMHFHMPLVYAFRLMRLCPCLATLAG